MCIYHLKWLTSARPRWPWTGSLFSKPHLNLVGLFMPILEIFLRNKYGKGTRAVWLELLVSSANTCSCVKYVSAIFNIFRDQLMCKDNPHIMVSHPPALVVGSFKPDWIVLVYFQDVCCRHFFATSYAKTASLVFFTRLHFTHFPPPHSHNQDIEAGVSIWVLLASSLLFWRY